MECPTLHGVEFGSDSKKAIETIRRINETANFIEGMTSGGVLVTIFSTKKPLEASYNIYSSDFVALAKALSSVEQIRKYKIEETALLIREKVSSGPEKQFWKAIYLGCKAK
ncbi:hypothetical protein [Bacterioplanoides sp.]|uniref:hypothetical protein n=1 Tax=Bacterioplanoides sp. TaxID=2066072 RepID=UPI003AFFF563